MNHWRRLSDRFAALQPREQMLVIVAGVAMVLVLCDFLLWSPLGTSSTALRNELNQLQQQRQSLQSQRADIKAQLDQDLDQSLRQQLEAIHARIDVQNQKMQALTVDLIRPDAMLGVLRDLIEQRKGLKLVALANDPAVLAFDKVHKPVDSLADGNGKAGLALIYKHRLTLTLKGSYFDILDYLQAVEGLPWHFFWEQLDYKVGHYPEAEVTIHVYTLGDQKGWIGA